MLWACTAGCHTFYAPMRCNSAWPTSVETYCEHADPWLGVAHSGKGITGINWPAVFDTRAYIHIQVNIDMMHVII